MRGRLIRRRRDRSDLSIDRQAQQAEGNLVVWMAIVVVGLLGVLMLYWVTG